jgi:outer membrane protein TolC
MFRGYLRLGGVAFLFIIWPYFFALAEGVSFTLEEAMLVGLRDNRGILLKEEDVKRAKVKIAESHTDLFPLFTLSGGWARTRNYYSKDLSQSNTQVSLRQYLYAGGRIFNTIKFNGYNFEIAKALLDKEKIETALKIKDTFYTLILAQEFVNLNKLLLENGQEHFQYQLERQKFGEISESAVLQAQSSLSNLEEVYVSSLNQVISAKESLINLLYLEQDVDISALGDIGYEEAEVALDLGLLKALEERPEIKQYAAQLQADKSAIEIAKASGRPDIYASWDYYSRSHTATALANTRGWNDHNVIGVNVSWPVFDGWKAKAKVEGAVFELKKTQLLKDKVIKDIILELKDAYLGLKDAIAKIKSNQTEIKVYTDNLKVSTEKYDKGQLSLLDKSDAEVKYAVAMFNYKQASYDYILAKAKFDKATGGL